MNLTTILSKILFVKTLSVNYISPKYQSNAHHFQSFEKKSYAPQEKKYIPSFIKQLLEIQN